MAPVVTSYSQPRRSRRVPALLPVSVVARQRAAVGVTVDLSAGGVGLQLNEVPKPGDTVHLRINMPGGLVIECSAEVMHAGVAEGDRCGLRFRDLDQQALAAIHSFVAKS